MSRSAPQPDHAAPVIQELLEWVPKHCINGTNGPSATPNRPFMPLPDLEAYLKAESRTSKLLRALYFEREHQVIVEFLEKWHIRVFTILTLIGKGRYIEHFVQHHNLRDTQLPFLEKPAHFPTDPNDPTFWDSFYEKQFAFCAHYFRYNENYSKLEDLCILPITSKEVLGQGGSAAIYKIKLHSYYDQLNPAADVSRANGARPANTYVLKTYNTKEADSYYNNEVDAFKKLATKNGIDQSLIQFLGSYRQGDTYNILLEYADRGTLEDFFRNVTPPSLGEDIVMFWGRLFNVIKALVRIHATERPDGYRGPDILIGWHQDVKPSNILVLSGKSSHLYDVEFKLADLGLSHFKRTAKLDRRIADSDIGGTKDYGAPECHRSDEFLEQSKLNVKPSIDIWSFGGVCSEAAVWVVLGISGVIDYRSRRQQEICEKGTLQDGCCFHDGDKVLETVEAMHSRLLKRGEVRPGDYVTRPVLDYLVTSMLEEDPDGRQNAIWLWKKSQKILKEAQLKLEESNQERTPRQVDPMVSNAQFFGRNMPETPPQTSHGAPQPYIGDSHPHGPPPNYPQYSPNSQVPGRSSSVKQTPKKRSDTWHEYSTKPDMAPGPLHGRSSPSIATRQQPGASPHLDMYPVLQEHAEFHAASSEETATGHGEKTWQNVIPLSYSPPNGSRAVNPLEGASVPRQGIRDFSPQELESGARIHHAQQRGSDADPALATIQNSGSSGPPLESSSSHAKVASISTGHGLSHPATGITLGEEVQSSTPKMPTPPPMANVTAAEPPAQKTKPEKPSLSFKVAKQIRERRGLLPRQAQDLLNDLKDRDHVFLMDDSLSMKDHWDDVISLFSVFAYFTKRLDDNGLEMYFTVSADKKSFRDTTPAVSHLKSTRQSTYSNINIRLEQILRRYQADLERQKERKGSLWQRPKVVKPLSLYVFTDAAWPGCDAVAPIEAMIEKLRQLELPKEQVGIQFVRFGNDPTGIERLEFLDSGLRKKYTKRWDIVDTEPFQNGNLLKMLLGAISDWFDDDEPD